MYKAKRAMGLKILYDVTEDKLTSRPKFVICYCNTALYIYD